LQAAIKLQKQLGFFQRKPAVFRSFFLLLIALKNKEGEL